MGALLFCMGDKRVVNERADLMFHDYSGGLAGKGGEIQARNEHTQKFIRDFFKEVILKQGFLSEKEFNNMLIGQDYWMDAEELCKRGIATHVLKNGNKITAARYLAEKFYVGEEGESSEKRKKKLKILTKQKKKEIKKNLRRETK
jgi:ATP-dependent protease ClpP protease subunit